MSTHSRKRQYSQSQRRRCTQIINVIVGDGPPPDGAYTKNLVEGISTIGPPSLAAIGASKLDAETLRSITTSPQPRLSTTSRLSRSGKSVTTYDGASVRSQPSIPGHLYASSGSSGSRPGLSPRSISRSANDVSQSQSYISQSSSQYSSNYSSIGNDPPRQPKPGYEWVWFPEGYWAEREIVGFATMSKWARRAANESQPSIQSSEVGPGMPGTLQSESNPEWKHPHTGSPTDPTPPKIGKARPKLSRRASGSTMSRISFKGAVLGKLSSISPAYPLFKGPDGSPEGLYCKTMRVLGGEGGRRKRTDNDSEATLQQQTPTPTKETLNGTSNYFSHFTRKKTSNTNPKSPDDGSETLSTKRKRLGIAPWHRKASDVSAVWSATSSIKCLLMGKTPMHSPQMERIQQEEEQYFQVDVSPGASEATPLTTPAPAGGKPLHVELGAGTPLVQSIRRVNTPPLVLEPGGKARGFFFDLTPPTKPKRSNSDSRSSYDFTRSQTSSSNPSHSNSNQVSSATTPSNATTFHSTAHFPNAHNPAINPHTTRPFTSKPSTPNGGIISRQWWDGDEDTIVSRAERRPITRGSFVLDIPEHLPSSPLCPMHPKHKSEGKGICPFHGRKKTEVGEGGRKGLQGFRN